MPYIVIDYDSYPPQPFVPAPIPGTGTPPLTLYGSGFNNLFEVVGDAGMAIESYPPGAHAGGNVESPYQTPPAVGSDPPTFRNYGGVVVSPPNPVQVFSSFEPNDQGSGGVPGTVQPPDVG